MFRFHILGRAFLALSLCCLSLAVGAQSRDAKPTLLWQLTWGGDVTARYETLAEAVSALEASLAQACVTNQGYACFTISNVRPGSTGNAADPVYSINGVPVDMVADYVRTDYGAFTSSGTTGGPSASAICPRSKPIPGGVGAPGPYSVKAWCSDPQPQEDPDLNICSAKAAAKVGNPILVSSGVKYQEDVDYESSTSEGLSFKRIYRSDRRQWTHNFASAAGNFSELMGPLPTPKPCFSDVTAGENPRRACFEYYSASTEALDFTAFKSSGFSTTFRGSPVAPTKHQTVEDALFAITDTASGAVTGWHLQRASDSAYEEYDLMHRLVSITFLNGRKIQLTYSDGSGGKIPASAPSCSSATGPVPAGKLWCVTNPKGRQLNFGYNSDGLLSKMINPQGGITSYEYDGASTTIIPPPGGFPVGAPVPSAYLPQMISRVVFPGGTSRTYFYNEQAFTSSVNLPYALTGIVNESGARLATFKYDTDGRAVSTEYAGGVAKFVVAGNSVTDPLGSIRTYAFESKLGQVRQAGVSQPAGAGCPAASSSSVSDDQLNPIQSVDFNQNVTTYTYDVTRSLELTRTEGVGSGAERLISQQWHPQARLMTRTAAPLLLTTFVYHGQPDPTNANLIASCAATGTPFLPQGRPVSLLCKRVEQATGDVNGSTGFGATPSGSARTWTFTYAADGQVLTENGPRTDVMDVTNYEYYATTDTAVPAKWYAGDLKKVTNAAGQVTTFDEYDLNGNLRRKTDSNGVGTLYTYSVRGWLTGVNVGAFGVTRTTSYDYWPTGKLKKVTQPDGSYLSYSYDPAQRLIGIADNLGNSVTYTLDNAGNRTAEVYKDSGGALKRNISRVFDSLGRLQSVTGALQ